MGDGEGEGPLIAPDADSRRRWLVVGMPVALVLLAAAIALASQRGGGEPVTVKSSPEIEPAQATTAGPSLVSTDATTPTGALEPTGTAAEVLPGEETRTAPARATPEARVRSRAPYVAFRRSGAVYVAREDGSGAVKAMSCPAGAFALSPDARTIAWVDPSADTLVLVDLSGKQTTRTVGHARQVTPVWSPDSAWLLAVRESAEGRATDVYRVDRTSGAVRSLGAGARATISQDGALMAIVPSASSEDANVLTLYRGGRRWRSLSAPGPILDAALSADRAYVATSRGSAGAHTAGIWSIAMDGSARLLATGGSAGEPGDLGMLTLAPDGEYLAYAVIGDDGYSRMSLVRTNGGSSIQVMPRKDAYPLGWTADSAGAFLLAGNAWQGEQTALVLVRPKDGTSVVIAQGAER